MIKIKNPLSIPEPENNRDRKIEKRVALCADEGTRTPMPRSARS
jgi:hypothetical protein